MYKITVPCLFGLEALVKKEIQNLGYNITSVDDGKVSFEGGIDAICRANIWLRTGERVLLTVGEFKATTFEELFDNIASIPWENYIPVDGKFWVKKASSIKSKLFSSSDIQSIVKKAMVERLKKTYQTSWFSEDKDEYPIRVFIKKDMVSVGIDTSGESLHKRGYREVASKAPISETLAAGLIMLSNWKPDKIFIDPFCGSGTIPIEAAMIGKNIAPGLNREFTSESWKNIIPRKYWMNAVDEANDLINNDVKLNIQGYDIDYRVLRVARENAKEAGVDEFIHFQDREVKDLSSNKSYGTIVTNPPYGERLNDKEEILKIYKTMGESFLKLDRWSYNIITSFEDFERYFGKQASKKRKLYNGMLKTNYYQYR